MGIGIGFGEILIVAATLAGFGIPIGMVPGEEDPYLCQIAAEDSYVYISWSGTVEANPDGNQTEKWISQKAIQDFWKKLYAELERVEDQTGIESPFHELTPIGFKMPRLIYEQPGAIIIDRINREGFAGNLVIKLGDHQADFEAVLATITDEVLAERNWTRKIEHGMTTLIVSDFLEQGVSLKLGIHKGYLMVAFAGNGNQATFDSIFANEKTPEPAWLTDIKNELPVDRRSSISMIDIERLLKLVEKEEGPIEYNPFAGVVKLGFVTGLNAESSVARTWIQTEGELGDFFTVLDGQPLGADELQSIPAGKTVTLVSRLSTEAMYDGIQKFASSVGSAEEFEKSVADLDGFMGMTLKEDLLAKLDDHAFFYGDFGAANLFQPPIMAGIGIKDEMAFLDTIEAFSQRIEEVVEENPDLEFSRQQINDTEVFSVQNQQPFSIENVYFAQMGTQLLISTNFETMKSHIEGSAQPAQGKFLFDQPEIKHIYEFAKTIGSDGPVGIFQLDHSTFFQDYWAMLNMQRQLAFPAHGGFGEPEEEDPVKPFTMPNLPPADAMTNGLNPSVLGMFKTKNGYQLYQSSVLPNTNTPLIAPSLLFGVGFARMAPAPMAPVPIEKMAPIEN